jgi:phospholipid/cholesterol/gamma-HCH transport system substrate-binding protein
LFGHFPRSLVNQTYTVYVEFSEAPGIAPDTPVRKNGILIGRVTKVALTGDHQERVRVTLAIDDDKVILHSDIVRISVSLLGDAEIQIIPAGEKQPGDASPVTQNGGRLRVTLVADKGDANPSTPVKPGETIQGSVANNPTQTFANLEPEMLKAARSLTAASDEVNKLAKDINKLLGTNNDQIDRLMNKTERSLDLLAKTMTNIDSIIGDPETNARMRQSISDLPGTLKELRDVLTSVQRTSSRAERNLENLEGFTKPLGQRGESLITSADQSVHRLDELLAQMQQFSRQLNSREGSLGQLMYNPQLYQNLNEAATNVNDLSRQLKPILCDVRAFSDKIARHPEVLGVKGAMQSSTGIK